jgi:excisionase family DNA binding protein
MRTIDHIVGMLAREHVVEFETRIRRQGFKTEEAASALGVSTGTVKRWCDSGRLESRREKFGRRFIAPESVLKLWEELTARTAQRVSSSQRPSLCS